MKIIKSLILFILSLAVLIILIILPLNLASLKVNSNDFSQNTFNKTYLEELRTDLYTKEEDLIMAFKDQSKEEEFLKYFKALNENKRTYSKDKVEASFLTDVQNEQYDEEFNYLYNNKIYQRFVLLSENSNLSLYLLLALVVIIILIFLICSSSSVLKSLSWTLLLSALVFLSTKFILNNYLFVGSAPALYLNMVFKYLKDYFFKVGLLYLAILLLILIIALLLNVFKRIKAKKKGLKTLDNFFDDYDEGLKKDA